jgi:ankyrin repeat protein
VAAEKGHTSVVRSLLAAGADAVAIDLYDHCALELAQMADKQECARVLIDAIGIHRLYY